MAFLVAIPAGTAVGCILYAVRAGESIGGTILDYAFFLPSLFLFGVPGVGIYALLLGLVRKERSPSTLTLVAFSPLIATGWFVFLRELAFTSLAVGGTMTASVVVFGLMMVGPFRQHLL
ncbi:MAG: hypothetical protein V4813_14925 [Gemmatimonadota bacterium]